MSNPQPNRRTAAPPTSSPATLNCPHCQTVITYYDTTGSSYYGCTNCRTFFKYEYEGPPVRIDQFRKHNFTLALPFGAEGYLFGQWVRMVGYAEKQEKGTSYKWREYYLLLQDGTYRQLAEYNDHWMWVEPANQTITRFNETGGRMRPSTNTLRRGMYVLRGEDRFNLYNKYGIELIGAFGEFDYNLFDDEKMTVVEYIAPPLMLIAEIDGETTLWYEGRYITPAAIEEGFGLAAGSLPKPSGVGAIQPNPTDDRWTPVIRLSALAAIAGLVLHLLFAMLDPHPSRVLYETLTVPSDSTVVGDGRSTIRTPSFQVNGPAHVGVAFRTDLDNAWAEFDTDLVNERTGQAYSFAKAVEYYRGVEDGESWSEGDKDEDASLNRIPSGKYHLAIKPYTESRQLSFTVEVRAGAAPFSNVLIWLALVAMYPAYLYFKSRGFESSRWAQSDYGPDE